MDTQRALDLTLLLPTVPLFAPLIAGLAAVVWLVDGGPVFFTQERVGKNGVPFRIHKLRTMTTEPDPKDRRPTNLGLWLRRRGLDELPQLYDVFCGSMSLVGPRPLLQSDIDRLSASTPGFEDRLASRPGLTGPAQVCQAQGPAATAKLDGLYAKNRSVRIDLGILLRTARMNLIGKSRGKWSSERAIARLTA